MSTDPIAAFPPFLNKTINLSVNDLEIPTRFTSTDWADHWRPFLTQLHARWQSAVAADAKKRYLIAIAGPPGSGKSVLAEQLHWLITNGALDRNAKSVALPMDGFHHPNTYLREHSVKLADGTTTPLSEIKGHPDTFNVPAFRESLQKLVTRPPNFPWPGYSRLSHDVLPNRFHVDSSVNIAIIEGNYLLLNRGQFAGTPALFDLRIYLEVPGAVIVTQLVERHRKGGRTLDQAKDWVRRIDLPNARIAESTKHHADVVFKRENPEEFSAITWRDSTPPT